MVCNNNAQLIYLTCRLHFFILFTLRILFVPVSLALFSNILQYVKFSNTYQF